MLKQLLTCDPYLILLKNMIKISLRGNKDLDIALLEYRNSPRTSWNIEIHRVWVFHRYNY